MEIADIVCINKYDGDYKKICERLKRMVENSLTLSMPKHSNFEWFPSVELVSAKSNLNIDVIWDQALQFREAMGREILRERRNSQISRGMWKFLGETIMKKLMAEYVDEGTKNKYKDIIWEAEQEIIQEKITGHEAAMRVINAIFSNEEYLKGTSVQGSIKFVWSE